MLLSASYFQHEDIVYLARNLIGKILFTRFQGHTCAAIITETEAYAGIQDKASHAYNGKYTPRTKTMFENGGIAYVQPESDLLDATVVCKNGTVFKFELGNMVREIKN